MAHPPKIPPRLHVLLARESATAVVFRRGPSSQYCTFGWDRTDDRFQLGQWLKRRIYERRTDLSPDGKHLLYFARSGPGLKAGGSYTALSRAPWLKAIALWVQDSSYYGGGLFIDNRRMHLRVGSDADRPLKTSALRVEPGWPYPGWAGYSECPGIYYTRLVRDGWLYLRPDGPGFPKADEQVFEKPLTRGWRLQKIAQARLDRKPGTGVYFDEHRLVHPKYPVQEFPAWDWADWDGDRRRLVYTTAGCLYAVVLLATGPGAPRLLHDFNGLQFENRQAPY